MAVPHVVEIAAVKADQLERLWRQEERAWNEKLCWDRADLSGHLWRAVADGSLSGKVLLVDGEILGCALYQNAGRLGLLSNFVVSPECRPGLAAALVQETVQGLCRS